MKTRITKKTIIVFLLIMISATSFYYVYKKTRINRPIAAKLVYNDTIVPSFMFDEITM